MRKSKNCTLKMSNKFSASGATRSFNLKIPGLALNYWILVLFGVMTQSSCMRVDRTIKEMYRSELYIDYRYVAFEGANQFQSIYFEVDSTNVAKYWGKIIINDRDTILVEGYEKGGFYPTWYRDNESNSERMLEIWCNGVIGQIPERIQILENDSVNGLVKSKTLLYRQPRKNC